MTKHFCVFGNPIAHSYSPFIHELFARQFGHAICYQRQLANEYNFEATVARRFRQNLSGANVTLPFKQRAFSLATRITAEARDAGAVNTLIPTATHGLLGANTDGLGLLYDLKRLNIDLLGKRVLLIGAGGAARGVLSNLLDEKPEVLWLYNRSQAKADALAAGRERVRVVSNWQELTGVELVINATSASLNGQLPAVPDNLLAASAVVYDMMYAATPTPFIRHVQSIADPACYDGLGMLVGQAAESYRLWWNCELPQIDPVIQQVRRALVAQ